MRFAVIIEKSKTSFEPTYLTYPVVSQQLKPKAEVLR
jgi:hypothetical protein